MILAFLTGMLCRALVLGAWWLIKAAVRHPGVALLVVLVLVAEGVITDGTVTSVVVVVLLAWTVASVMSSSRARTTQPAPQRTARVSRGGGHWEPVETRDALDHTDARIRRRYARAQRRARDQQKAGQR